MKRLKFLPIYFIGIITIFVAIMAYVRLDNNRQLEHNFYTQWRKHYVVHLNKYESYVNTTPHSNKKVALSEGQGYGMYITVLAAKKKWASKKQFAQLNNFYLRHREDVKGKKTALMSWRITNQNGKVNTDQTSATDGDLFIAEALLLAGKEWQDGEYIAEAKSLMRDILHYEYNTKTGVLTVGDWANSKSPYYDMIRTSDVMPIFFTDFYRATHDNRWLTVRDIMLKRLNQLSHQHKSGLVPDFAWVSKKNAKPVKPSTVATKYDGDFSANACRVPMMLAESDSPLARNTTKRMLKFFSKQNTVTAGYTLKGKPLNDYQSASFSAPIFLAVTYNRNQGYDNLFMSQQYIFTQHLPTDNYYDATLIAMVALEAGKL